jgi:hypothetical protein
MKDRHLDIPGDPEGNTPSEPPPAEAGIVMFGRTGSGKQSSPSASLRATLCAATGQLDLFSKCTDS